MTMLDEKSSIYDPIHDVLNSARATPEVLFKNNLPFLIGQGWTLAYRATVAEADVVTVPLDPFAYLVDIAHDRVLGAYCITNKPGIAGRTTAGMRHYSVNQSLTNHTGRLAPRTGNAASDIDLFLQLQSLSTGALQNVERVAKANPGSFYFVRVVYDASDASLPRMMEQGLILPELPLKLAIKRINL